MVKPASRKTHDVVGMQAGIAVDPGLLADSWFDQLVSVEGDGRSNSSGKRKSDIVSATKRSIPLLDDGASSVPFVCRYRTDVIHPLSTKQVHALHDLIVKHQALSKMREKLFEVVPSNQTDMLHRIQTSTSKAELDDLYAPFKPPSKGSIAERIQKEHPQLVDMVDQLWNGANVNAKSLKPNDAAVHLVATKLAAEPLVMDVVLGELTKHCRITVKVAEDPENKYRDYHDFQQRLVALRDHQTLAIRRGVDQKALKLSYNVDGDKMEGCLRWNLFNQRILDDSWKSEYAKRQLLSGALHDAWTRLLRRRGTNRLWSQKCKEAEERAIQVFEDNLRNALLAPPMQHRSKTTSMSAKSILAMDPGFQAGIKCAVLEPNGEVKKLSTVQFLGNKRERALDQLQQLLLLASTTPPSDRKSRNEVFTVVVALGNGHGSQESRALVQEASKACNIPIDIRLVNEAGASVWSVTDMAQKEFPEEAAASVAAVSIGRRLLNPLHELVKVPPRSLGLGMYQHDLSEKELDEKLHLTSVDAVATIGVDVNSCSIEILEKVPGITTKLATKIRDRRPIFSREDLKSISGMGPKTFENCAAFVRVSARALETATEPLDGTLVHPESYGLAKWLLKHLKLDLRSIVSAESLPSKTQWSTKLGEVIGKASQKFRVSNERVLAVLENLVDSILQVDPRFDENASCNKEGSAVGSPAGCTELSPEQKGSSDKIRGSCPLRGIVGVVRNIADFGVFIDFGGPNDGLLHRSKLGGEIRMESLLIGQELGIDILAVDDKGRISLALHGLGFNADPPRGGARRTRGAASRSSGRIGSSMRSFSSSSKRGSKRSQSKTASSSSKNTGYAKRRRY